MSRSDLLTALSGQLSDSWFLDSGFQYSTSKTEFQRTNIAARYNADGGRILNFSYRYTRDSLKQVDISAQWPFGKAAPAWTLLARANHSFQDKRLIEGLVGVEYNQGCWEFRLGRTPFCDCHRAIFKLFPVPTGVERPLQTGH